MTIRWDLRAIDESALIRRVLDRCDDPDFLRAFTVVTNCYVQGPGGRVEAELDPSFIVFAVNDEHECAYGLYLYPPLLGEWSEPPVVEVSWEDKVGFKLVAGSLEAWLRDQIEKARGWFARNRRSEAALLERTLGLARPSETRRSAISAAQWAAVLPTRETSSSRERASLWRWLLEPPPASPEALLVWEREWTRWWVADVADELAHQVLCDYGIEAYTRLGWRAHAELLEADAPESRDAAARSARQNQMWALVHPPTRAEVPTLVDRMAGGEPRATEIVACWSTLYSWRAIEQGQQPRAERERLGQALLSAARAAPATSPALARLLAVLVDLEYDEAVEPLTALPEHETIRSAITVLRARCEEHAVERRMLRSANDWSDV